MEKIANLLTLTVCVGYLCWIVIGGGQGDVDIITHGTTLAFVVVLAANMPRMIRRWRMWNVK